VVSNDIQQFVNWDKLSRASWGVNAQPAQLNLASAAAYLWLCQAPLRTETGTERLLDHEIGCYLGVASLWDAYLGVAGRGEAEAAYGRLVTAYQYARGVLGAVGAKWLDASLQSSVPSAPPPTGASPRPTLTGLKTYKTLKALADTSVSPVQLFTAVRDAVVSANGQPLYESVYTTYDREPPLGVNSTGNVVDSSLDLCVRPYPGDPIGELNMVPACEVVVSGMAFIYKTTGSSKAYAALVAAYQAGRSRASTRCMGWACRNEYEQDVEMSMR